MEADLLQLLEEALSIANRTSPLTALLIQMAIKNENSKPPESEESNSKH